MKGFALVDNSHSKAPPRALFAFKIKYRMRSILEGLRLSSGGCLLRKKRFLRKAKVNGEGGSSSFFEKSGGQSPPGFVN